MRSALPLFVVMSQKIQQAVNQVRLTNVAVVRLKRHGKRFEVACYRNKIENWRSGLETDIDEVLQIDRVFENVSKGVVAKTKDLEAAFGTSDTEAVCRIILSKGTSQISEGERAVQIQNRFKNVATIVSEKCVNPQNMRPYPVSTIETAMRDTIHFAAVTSKSAKQQALEVIRELEKVMPIKRAQMLVRVAVEKDLKDEVTKQVELIDGEVSRAEETVDSFVQQIYLDPGHFRALSEFVAALNPPGSIEVKDFSVQDDTEADVETADAKRTTKSGKAAASTEANDEDIDDGNARENDDDGKSNDAKSKGDTEELDPYEEQVMSLQKLKIQQKKNKKKKKKDLRRLAREEDDDNDDEEDDKPSKSEPASATTTTANSAAPAPTPAVAPAAPNTDTGGLRCRTCNVAFGSDRTLQREHYKTDLHRLNLKLSMKKLPCMTQEEFDLLGPEERDAILLDYA